MLFSQKVCSIIQRERGKDYAEAYLFVRRLATLTRHPILFNFKANLTAYRLKTGYTDKRFRQLLASALTNNLAYYEGLNLRLYSHTAERKAYRAKDYQEIKESDAKAFLYISTLKRNTKQQVKAIKYKASTLKKVEGASETLNLMRQTVNYNVTLSYRKIAELLQVSVSHAYKLAKELSPFGLVLTPNRTLIGSKAFAYYRSINQYNTKVIGSDYYFIGANIAKFTHFYKTKGKGIPYYQNDNW